MTTLLLILSSISSYVFGHLSPEARARQDYPMRAMRDMVDEVLERFPAWGAAARVKSLFPVNVPIPG
jgi:hypothetical protein